MIYAEASYFDGAHVQHIADWQAHVFRQRRDLKAREIIKRKGRR